MNSQVMKLPPLSPGLDMDSYLRILGQFPILSAGEERELAIKFTEGGDLDAARKLVLGHLRFVAYLARSYKGYGLPYEDLVQEGNVGLMKAVKRFDPSFGVRLISFAAHWIKAEIHEYILKNWRIVKVATTKAQRKLFFNLRSAKKILQLVRSPGNARHSQRFGGELGGSFKNGRKAECKRFSLRRRR